MRVCDLRDGAIWRGRRGSRFAAACFALGFALAGAAVADEVDAEPSTSEPPEERMVLLILDGGLRYEGTIRNGKMHGEGNAHLSRWAHLRG